MHALPLTMVDAIGWSYLVTNAARIFTFVPQIIAVWRSTDGARAISLCTWSAWLVSHVTAILYGTLVTHDIFFVLIALINFCGCGAVTLIAWQRRMQWRKAQEPRHSVRSWHPPLPHARGRLGGAPAASAVVNGGAAHAPEAPLVDRTHPGKRKKPMNPPLPSPLSTFRRFP